MHEFEAKEVNPFPGSRAEGGSFVRSGRSRSAPPIYDPFLMDSEKTLPASAEAEIGTLSSLMLNCGRCLEIVGEKLKAEHFHNPANRIVFETIVGLHNAGNPYDMISLTAEFQKRRVLDEIGGASRLAEISGALPTAENVQYYVEVMLDCYHRRELIRVANGLETSAYESAEDLPEAAKVAEETIKSWREGTLPSTDDPTSPSKILDYIVRLEERYDTAARGEIAGVPTGIETLDSMSGGLRKRKMYVVAAPPFYGKSLLLSQIPVKAARILRPDGKYYKSLIFSLEMDEDEYWDRILSQDEAAPIGAISSGLLSEHNFTRITSSLGHLRNHIFVDGSGCLTASMIAAKIKQALISHPDLDLICIDYLQEVIPESTKKSQTSTEQYTQVCQDISRLKKRFNLPILTAAKMNRNREGRKDRRLKRTDIYGASQIESDADGIFLLDMDDQDDLPIRKGTLIVDKLRGSSARDIPIELYRRHVTLREVKPNDDF